MQRKRGFILDYLLEIKNFSGLCLSLTREANGGGGI